MSSKNETIHRRDDEIILSEGLVGLPNLKRWILKDMDPPMPLKWLESLDRPGFRLPVTDPVYYDEAYAFELDDRAETLLHGPTAEDLVVMIVTNIHDGGERITGNMAAPVVVNVNNRNGLQCILNEQNYCLHHEIDYVRFGNDVAALEAESGISEADGSVNAGDVAAQGDACDENQDLLLVRS
jgi:flagellar assembly factor FliW